MFKKVGRLNQLMYYVIRFGKIDVPMFAMASKTLNEVRAVRRSLDERV